MYIKTQCPVCGTDRYHNIKLHALEKQFTDLETVTRYTVEYIEVSDKVTEEELAREVLESMRPYVHDGVEVRELWRILKKYYGVAATYCCDLLPRLKIEMEIYCPDRRHLFFVKAMP
ncbi:hypothetical protein MSMTP_1959 [Methanosarcina sp. MTP4]|uniref:hypothetical protein n=1 Tax=Methanosarcina sp. MTP4 TaxID=1434100 RepID=UPI0006154992|nr:hypothetical protein [Methanosarcina sp. MTP4]AKB25428.1 hypothetical protein MSMTP_1959 [Methanosarcina sp. MTP4]